ncbi:MAG: M14 family metallopeptidase [Cyclobacteriaceae bacterium]|nr:M14 family metallopeptidase [Cyclobacteriaceae bacterium]
MKSILLLLGYIMLFYSANAQLQTVFEKSEGKETATYYEVISYYKALSEQYSEVSMQEIGMTDSGFPLHLVTVSTSREFSFSKAHKNDDAVILINNGIHPGEPDGIEACMMLVRDVLSDKKKRAKLEGITLAIIPIYNIGGALNRNSHSRANQNGPNEYGFRGNAKNLDLNRDFIKMDSKNAKTFARIYHKVKPDILVDTHVSNGADYQYNISHLTTQPDKLGGELGYYLRTLLIPKIEESMKSKGDEIIPYVNVFNTTPDAKGYQQFMDYPRYSSGYTALYATIGFTTETHMLKPFDVRVSATYRFIESMLEIAQKDGLRIKVKRASQLTTSIVGKEVPIHWALDTTKYRTLLFKGYEGRYQKSEVTGFDRLYYDREKPFTKEIPYYNEFIASTKIVAPKAYVIPQAWSEVIDRLQLNDVKMKRLKSDTTIAVERYRIAAYATSKRPYEAHYPHNNTQVVATKKNVLFRKGDYWISMNQPAARFLIEVLEPQASDSYFNWNFFDTILQQKEHFSPYVFEETAQQLLLENKKLKTAFETKKKEEQDFANSPMAQLNYIYKNSPHFEANYLQYPVFRVLK